MLETFTNNFSQYFLLLKFNFSYNIEEQLPQKQKMALFLFVTKSCGQFHSYQTSLRQSAPGDTHFPGSSKQGSKSDTRPLFPALPRSLTSTSVSTLVKCRKCYFPIILCSVNCQNFVTRSWRRLLKYITIQILLKLFSKSSHKIVHAS